mmetsp:Transcript_43192/g.71743  ORF Transcript_43192/g.71743 Transcript_43192/m.71743 type:complete len:220 (-) Transcript_43192:272-931(-)
MLKLGRRRREGRLIDGDDDDGKDSTHFSASEDNFTVEEEEEEEVGTEQELGELQLVEQPGREKIGVETKELCDGNSNLEWKGNNSCERGSRKRWRAMEWRSSQSDYISGYAESMEDTGEIRELGTELNGDQLNITESKEGGARGIDWKKNDAKIPLFNKRNLRRYSYSQCLKAFLSSMPLSVESLCFFCENVLRRICCFDHILPASDVPLSTSATDKRL